MAADNRLTQLIVVTFVAWGVAQTCCVPHHDAHGQARVPAVSGAGSSTSGKMWRLLVHSSEPHGKISSAKVVATAKDGTVVALGETDEWGTLEVEKVTLREIQPTFIVVCAEWYFCGAVAMDEETLERFDEEHIELAGWTIH